MTDPYPHMNFLPHPDACETTTAGQVRPGDTLRSGHIVLGVQRVGSRVHLELDVSDAMPEDWEPVTVRHQADELILVASRGRRR